MVEMAVFFFFVGTGLGDGLVPPFTAAAAAPFTLTLALTFALASTFALGGLAEPPPLLEDDPGL
jgi:hypothetical protein